jgi:hypothetical protein
MVLLIIKINHPKQVDEVGIENFGTHMLRAVFQLPA